MSESTIITGQFVRISQTPASAWARVVAFFIDLVVIILYVSCLTALLAFFRIFGRFWTEGFSSFLFIAIVYLPAWGYPFLCETFNHGQSVGKRMLNMRVVKADGSTPSIGAYLLRWLLLTVDLTLTSGLGFLIILFTKNNQRLGDLAAGTIVIQEKDYRKIHVSLDEFNYLMKGYQPVYPQAADLSLEQVNVITRTLESNKRSREQRIPQLSKKVQELLSVTPRDNNQEKFLQTVLRDYQYYALEEI